MRDESRFHLGGAHAMTRDINVVAPTGAFDQEPSIVREVFAADEAIHTRPRIIEAGALPNSQ